MARSVPNCTFQIGNYIFSFIRSTFLIGFTDFEIFWVEKMAAKNKQDPILLLSFQMWYQSMRLRVKKLNKHVQGIWQTSRARGF